jgi:hypothetical protein
MDFFAQLIKQPPPVNDKDNQDLNSLDSEGFTVNREKGLKGFNDDVSEIEIGEEHINEDSIN